MDHYNEPELFRHSVEKTIFLSFVDQKGILAIDKKKKNISASCILVLEEGPRVTNRSPRPRTPSLA